MREPFLTEAELLASLMLAMLVLLLTIIASRGSRSEPRRGESLRGVRPVLLVESYQHLAVGHSSSPVHAVFTGLPRWTTATY